MDDNRFYVYILIDPRDNQVFYIGKGTANRIKHHEYEARNTDKNSKKLNKIRKIESLGLRIVSKRVENNISDSDAKELEMLLIAECLDLGIDLCNMTLGGDGCTGCKPSQATRQKISAAQKGVPKNLSEDRIEELRILMSGEGNPSFATILKVTSALGIRLHAQPASNA